MPKINKRFRSNTQKRKLTTEGRLSRNQYVSSFLNRSLCYNIWDEPVISEQFKDQVRRSCRCRNRLLIAADLKIAVEFSCKYRWCDSCYKYLMMKRRMLFGPSIDGIHQAYLKDPKKNSRMWFLTLTKPIVRHDEYVATLERMRIVWREIFNAAKRKKLKNFNGLRKMEVSVKKIKGLRNPLNHEDYTYHVHLHVLIQGRANYLFMKNEWLKRYPEALRELQVPVPYDGRLAEMVKYIAKPFCPLSLGKDSSYSKALGFAHDKFRNKRTFFSYGSIKAVRQDEFEAWVKGLEKEDAEALEASAKTNEEAQRLSAAKKQFAGEILEWKKAEGVYISQHGEPLTDLSDFDPKKDIDRKLAEAAFRFSNPRPKDNNDIMQKVSAISEIRRPSFSTPTAKDYYDTLVAAGDDAESISDSLLFQINYARNEKDALKNKKYVSDCVKIRNSLLISQRKKQHTKLITD